MGVVPAIAWNAARPGRGRAPEILAAVVGLMPGIHFKAGMGRRFTSTGTGSAVIDRIPWSTTTASRIVLLVRRIGIPARIG